MNEAEGGAVAEVIYSGGTGGRAWYGFALKAALGLAVVSLLVWHFDLRSTFHVISREQPLFFAAAVALYVAGQLMSAFRWQLLARLNRIDGRYRDYAGYYFIGIFTNLFVPGLIGGDAMRALYLGRLHRRMSPAIASVVADRGVGLVTLFWFASAAALTISNIKLPSAVLRAAVAVGAISLLGYGASPFLAKLPLYIGGRIGRLLEPIRVYLARPLALIPAIMLSAILQFSLVVCQYLLGLGLGLDISLLTFLLIVPLANVIASLPVTINGLGVRDATYLVLLGMAGMSKDAAVALSLLYFAATLVGGLAGLPPFVTMPLSPSDPARSGLGNTAVAAPASDEA